MYKYNYIDGLRDRSMKTRELNKKRFILFTTTLFMFKLDDE